MEKKIIKMVRVTEGLKKEYENEIDRTDLMGKWKWKSYKKLSGHLIIQNPRKIKYKLQLHKWIFFPSALISCCGFISLWERGKKKRQTKGPD